VLRESINRMAEQLSLAGFDVARRRTDRLFFALLPDADAAAQIAQCSQRLRRQFGLSGRPIATERLHITLHYLGDYVGLPPRVVAAASAAAATVAMPPFDVTLDRAASFCHKPRNRPFVLLAREGIVPLTALRQAFGAEMTKALVRRSAKSHFTPHLTLLYDDLCVEKHAIEPIVWTAHEFVLVHSLLGLGRHVALARWPLAG
jgi:RNA 2',3'-cyclic 3'-phosphodiesterase